MFLSTSFQVAVWVEVLELELVQGSELVWQL
jgi:hypothetical protein